MHFELKETLNKTYIKIVEMGQIDSNDIIIKLDSTKIEEVSINFIPYDHIDYYIECDEVFATYIAVTTEEINGKYLMYFNSCFGFKKDDVVMMKFIDYLEDNHLKNVAELMI